MFNFHPFYVGINETDFSRYLNIKRDLCQSKSLYELTEKDVAPYCYQGVGAGSFFQDLIRDTARHDRLVMNASEIAALYFQSL
jgi:hypothetical protein